MKARSGMLLAAMLAMVCVLLPPVPPMGYGWLLLCNDIDSLEWMAARADRIVRGRIPSPFDNPANTALPLQVLETFKGPKAETLSLRSSPAETEKGDWLFFLQEDPRNPGLFIVRNTIGLAPGECMRMDFSIVSGRDSILQAVRDAVGFLPTDKKPDRMVIRIPNGTPAQRIVEKTMVKSIAVPTVSRMEELAHQWVKAENREYRLVALQVLQHFRSPANIQLLKGLLDDPDNFVQGGVEKPLPFPLSFIRFEQGGTRYYPVRQTAYEILGRWNVNVPAPLMEEPADQISAWTIALIVSVPMLVLLVALGLVVRFRRRKATTATTALSEATS